MAPWSWAPDLTGIRDADAGVGREIDAQARFDQQAVACDRHARRRKRRAAVAECEQRLWRQVAEGVPPSERAGHCQRLMAGLRQCGGRPQTQGGEGDAERIVGAGERSRAARLGEAVAVEVDVGEVGKRFGREIAKRKGAADFAECLGGVGAIARLGGVEKTREGDRSVAVDVMPGERCSSAQAPRAELAAAIDSQVIVVDSGGGAPVVNMQRRLRIAAG
nr:hypothetical protein [Bradyrhizobium diazoefficiens]